MASKKVKVIIAGILGAGIVALLIKNSKSLASKPDLFIRQTLPGSYNALTVPPFGIFIRADQQNNAGLLQHELIHWKQYQEKGLLKYYSTYFGQLISDGYDKMPMELEARANETDFCKENYTQCVRNGRARTVKNPAFRT